ncbi:transglutaminase domain-containing protein [Micromonospora sp. RP3T]|uniref:transglutaminase domain-containing protein n=1 Tax=Micromonospora sp. RP3T TaxID=2135446 RepID=UPI003D740F09
MTTVPAGDELAILLDKLRRIPDEARVFSVSRQAAWRYYFLSRDILDAAVAMGLPHTGCGEESSFDLVDVMNLALHLGRSPAARAARRFWSAALNRPRGAEPLHYEVQYRASCPVPGHEPPCRYQVILSPEETIHRTVGSNAEALAAARVALTDDWPELTPAAGDLLREVSGLQFMRLPPSLRRDVDFIRRTGLADCAGSAAMLKEAGSRYGLRVRSSYGFIVVPPFSTTHHWAEIRQDGRWVPVDPVLITAMIEWGVLDPGVWHPNRSPGLIFSRVCDSGSDLVTHDGTARPVMLTLPTRRLC